MATHDTRTNGLNCVGVFYGDWQSRNEYDKNAHASELRFVFGCQVAQAPSAQDRTFEYGVVAITTAEFGWCVSVSDWAAQLLWVSLVFSGWFLDGLQGRFISLTQRMQSLGANLGNPHAQALGNGRFELLLSFVKKTQKTPLADLAIARQRLKEVKHADT